MKRTQQKLKTSVTVHGWRLETVRNSRERARSVCNDFITHGAKTQKKHDSDTKQNGGERVPANREIMKMNLFVSTLVDN